MDRQKTYTCDIIVVTWNKLDYIRQCVESILRYTEAPCRLIIVDNASDEDTRRYLAALEGSGAVAIRLIQNDANVGPGKARNIALRHLDAEYVCFIDSDVVVTPGWLANMIAVARSSTEIGMVNPSSNNYNQVPPAGMSFYDYARTLAPLKQEYLEVGHCISFCMLIKAEVAERIGPLDEGYILALYEDTDYSMKATSAGYRCVIARGAYVWHYGHGSTSRVKKMDEIAEKNRKRFYQKWGRPLRIFWGCAAPFGSDAFRDALARSIQLAREGHYVYFSARGSAGLTCAAVFTQCGFHEHANVHVTWHRGMLFGWFCLWRVLVRRKKGYDIVVTDDRGLAKLTKRLGFLHRAEAVDASDAALLSAVSYRKKFEGLR